jgi:hypothetical protein
MPPSLFQRVGLVLAMILSTACGASAVGVAPPATEQTLSDLVRRTILDNLPREFASDADWGQKKEVASGLKFKTEGGRLRIEKRTKAVNDGLWTQYKVALVDPSQNFRVRIAQLRRIAPGRVAFQLFLSARLQGEARYERWRRGVKMLNFKTDADSTVEAEIDCEVGLRFVPGRFLSDLVVEPKVSGVKLALVDINLQRVSRIDGAVAEELGDRLRHTLDKELRGRQDEIAQKLNAAIREHPEKLRFSAERLFSFGWSKAQALMSALANPPAAPASR